MSDTSADPSSETNVNGTALLPISTTSTDSATLESCVLSVEFVDQVFQSDCYECDPVVGIDKEWVVVSRDFNDVQFFSLFDGKLEVMTTTGIDYYVSDIAISGTVAVLGAAGENNYAGSVYVYERDSSGIWNQTAHIPYSNTSHSAMFGNLVDIDGDVLVIGATDDQDKMTGSVYIYRHIESTWELESKLAPDGPGFQNFGSSVAVKGSLLAVGDYWFGDDDEGIVFVYEYNSRLKSWMQIGDSLQNDNCDGEFGSSLAWTDDGGLMIGCSAENYYIGAVYFYRRLDSGAGIEFVLDGKITPSDGTPWSLFAFINGIALDESIMLVGTYRQANGKAYLFHEMDDYWKEVYVFFGSEVAMSGQNAFISSKSNVYYYKLELC